MSSDPNILKLCVLGGGGVGKSALTLRIISNTFAEDYDPTIEDLYRMSFFIDNQNVTIDILDTAGQDDFSAMQDQWIREGDGFLLVYSVTSLESFNEVKQIYEKIKRSKSKNIPIVLVGNKCDQPHPHNVNINQGEELAKSWGVSFFETSAKTKVNNETCFYQTVTLMKENNKPVAKDKKKKFCTLL